MEINFFGSINFEYRIYLENLVNDKIKLKFHGHIKQNFLLEQFKKSDLLIFPSVSEGLPLSAIQALNFGLPVFASYNSNLHEILPDFCIYKTRDPLDFYNKFLCFMSHKSYSLKNSPHFEENYIKNKWIEVLCK